MIKGKLIILAFVILNANASNVILKQGEVEITFDDIDGYAYTIPEDKREGFFSSKIRVEKTLVNILNMKQIVNYARKKNLIDKAKVESEIEIKLLGTNTFNINKPSPRVSDFQNYKNYLLLKESYKYFQLDFKAKIKREPLEEMAQEMYHLNKNTYKVDEARNFLFIETNYNSANKEEKTKKLLQLKDKILEDKNFLETINNQEDKDIHLSKEFKNFKFDNKYLEFSKHIFSTKQTGLIQKILEVPPKLYLVYITKIINSRYLPYTEVKDKIIDKLVVQKFERDFNNLLDSITKDEIKFDKTNIESLTSRYSKLAH